MLRQEDAMIIKSKKLIPIITLFMIMILPAVAIAGKHVVVIDPAHGGSDRGVKLSMSLYEKDVTLTIAKLVKENLSGVQDITLKLTRSDDTNVSPATRKKIAVEAGADLFVSIHVNAGFGLDAKGYEIYYPVADMPSAEKINSGEILKDMNQTERLNSSVIFAQIIRKNMEKIFPREGRGLRNAPIFVLQSMTMPGVLLETGFATNLENKKKLKDKKVDKAIADAISESIKKYFSTGGK